jgi:hypothetical protein
MNLLDNAVKVSPDGSTVSVRQARCLLTGNDEGAGIPAADREAAFDRFWRGADVRGLPGSGLGAWPSWRTRWRSTAAPPGSTSLPAAGPLPLSRR